MSDTVASTMEPRHEAIDESGFASIAGVDLELYTLIVRSIAAMNHDLSMLGPMAALHGLEPAQWHEARQGWNQRIATDGAVNSLFRELYHAM